MERSPELDKVRQLLFPALPAEEGWARIEAAFAGASDPERLDAIEELAARELSGDLLGAVRRLHEREREETPPPPAAA